MHECSAVSLPVSCRGIQPGVYNSLHCSLVRLVQGNNVEPYGYRVWNSFIEYSQMPMASDLPSPWQSAEGWAGTWTYQMQCVSVWLRDAVPLWLYHPRVHAWETLNALISGEQVLWTPTLERVSWATPDALCESLVSVPAAGERPGFQSQPTPWLADQAEPKRPCPQILCPLLQTQGVLLEVRHSPLFVLTCRTSLQKFQDKAFIVLLLQVLYLLFLKQGLWALFYLSTYRLKFRQTSDSVLID